MAVEAAPERASYAIGPGAAAMLNGGLAAFLVSGALFTFFPQADLAVSKQFFVAADGSFAGNERAVEVLRNSFKTIYILACVSCVIGAAISYVRGKSCLRLSVAQHLFMIACLGIGPGLVTNVALKDHWGRARPREVVEFGGTKVFTPALTPSRACKRNCSFVAGEASSLFMIGFALVLLYAAQSIRAIDQAPWLLIPGLFGAIALVRMRRRTPTFGSA